jgi:hypothetical protein
LDYKYEDWETKNDTPKLILLESWVSLAILQSFFRQAGRHEVSDHTGDGKAEGEQAAK